jgi:acyl-CoA dehydrogenase
MALVLNDDERMVKDTADQFFAEAAPVAELRRLRDSADPRGFSPDLWARMAELGLSGVLVDESHGGTGLGMMAAGLIAEAVGRNLSASPFLSTSVLAATLVGRGGTEEQKARLLPKIAAGGIVIALAIDERARHAPARIDTRAVAAGNGFRLSGDKRFVIDGPAADLLIVAARTSGEAGSREGLSLFLVDPAAPGVTRTPRTMVDSRAVADIHLADVAVDDADRLGPLDGAWPLIEAALDAGRTVLAAEMLGVAEQSFATTVEYLKTREQFGRPIGSFQGLQHRAAHLFCEIELARSVVMKALRALDEGDMRGPVFASLAKAKLGDVAKLATNEAVQMHGGIGMTDDCDVGFYMKRARAAGETFGDTAFHGERIARIMRY